MANKKFSTKERKELLEQAHIEHLSYRQLITLFYWECCKPKKIAKFYDMLAIGKSARFAFKDAKDN